MQVKKDSPSTRKKEIHQKTKKDASQSEDGHDGWIQNDEEIQWFTKPTTGEESAVRRHETISHNQEVTTNEFRDFDRDGQYRRQIGGLNIIQSLTLNVLRRRHGG